MSTTAFDDLAADYDATFTDTPLARTLRAITWARIDRSFTPGMRVLEVGCGTGEDAVHLARRGVSVAATDASAAMVAATTAKVSAAGLSELVEARTLPIEDIGVGQPGGSFDGVLANFGSFNCVSDLSLAARSFAAVTRPGGVLIAVVMGPVVPWEWAWQLAHGKPRAAVRRLRTSTTWRGLTIRYPSVRRLRRTFAPEWALGHCQPVGIALPPSYAENWTRRHPRALRLLTSAERGLARVPGSASLADHYLVEFHRR